MSDLKNWKKHWKTYDAWRKKTTDTYLRANLHANVSRNVDVLRGKSIPDKLNRMSGCEKMMIEKINNERFGKNRRGTVFIENKVMFVDGRTVLERRGPTVDEELILDMRNEVRHR